MANKQKYLLKILGVIFGLGVFVLLAQFIPEGTRSDSKLALWLFAFTIAFFVAKTGVRLDFSMTSFSLGVEKV